MRKRQSRNGKIVSGKRSLQKNEGSRRVAPGWLDRDKEILEPVKAGKQAPQPDLLDAHISDGQSTVMAPAVSPNREGEEPNRAFGGLNMK
jgi:hypothetical protein